MYDNATEMVKDQESEKQETCTRLAIVTALFEDGCPKIRFYGEDVSSEKEYSYVSTYIPAVNDIVVLAKTDSSYIILGKINHKVTPDTKIDDDYIKGIIDDYMSGKNYVVTLSDGTIYISADYYSYINNLKTVNLTNTGVYRHQGSKFGVLGKEPREQYTLTTLTTAVDTSTLTSLGVKVSDCTNKINTIISLLKGFGFSS